jgi:hypothetical protein
VPQSVRLGRSWRNRCIGAYCRLVAHGRSPERRNRLLDPPSEVWVTVVVARRRDGLGRPLRALGRGSRGRSVTRWIAALAAVAALAGAAAGVWVGSNTNTRHARAPEAGILAQATSYRFPLGCLGSRLSSPSSPQPGDVTNRIGPCWHYGVYVTAVLRRVHGVWRLTLDARSNSCPHVPIPAKIRALLAACAKTDSPALRIPEQHSLQPSRSVTAP